MVVFSQLSAIKHEAKDRVLKLFKVTWVFDPDPLTIQGTCSLIEYTANEGNCGPRNQTQVLSWIFFIEMPCSYTLKDILSKREKKKTHKKAECSGHKSIQAACQWYILLTAALFPLCWFLGSTDWMSIGCPWDFRAEYQLAGSSITRPLTSVVHICRKRIALSLLLFSSYGKAHIGLKIKHCFSRVQTQAYITVSNPISQLRLKCYSWKQELTVVYVIW